MNLSDHKLGEACLEAHANALEAVRKTRMHDEVANSLMAELNGALIAYTGELVKRKEGMISNVMGKEEVLDRTALRLEREGINGDKYAKGTATAFVATYKDAVQRNLGIDAGLGIS